MRDIKRVTPDVSAGPERIAANTHPIYRKIRGAWFAVYWNMAAWAWMAIGSMEWDVATWWPVIVFPSVVGVGLAAVSIGRLVRRRRDGPAYLRLDPPRPRIGGSVHIHVECERPPASRRIFVVRLQCEKGSYYEDGRSASVHWKSPRQAIDSGAGAEALFALPPDLPPTTSNPAEDIDFRWSAILDRGGYTHEFDIPVLPAAGDVVYQTPALPRQPARRRVRDRESRA